MCRLPVYRKSKKRLLVQVETQAGAGHRMLQELQAFV
jgi:hypothetical protein